MDRLKSADLNNVTFQKQIKGYDPVQVNLLVERAKMEIATLTSELTETHEELDRVRKAQENYLAQENALKEALLLAQRTADDLKLRTQKESDELLANARQEAEELRSTATRETDELRSTARRETEELRASARREAEDLRASAKKDAEGIVSEARRQGEELEKQFQSKINDLRWELERMRAERQRFAAEFRTTLEGFLRELNEEEPPAAVEAVVFTEAVVEAPAELNGTAEAQETSDENSFAIPN